MSKNFRSAKLEVRSFKIRIFPLLISEFKRKVRIHLADVTTVRFRALDLRSTVRTVASLVNELVDL